MKRRLFVAIEFTPPFKDILADTIEQLKDHNVKGRYERVGNLHVTLAFIGETEQLEDIKKAMAGIAFAPFEIAPGNFGIFDRHGILWLGLTNEKALKFLASEVRKKLEEAGIPYSNKQFVPHITLVKDVRFEDDEDLDVDFLSGTMTVSKISVMETIYESGHRKYVER